MGNLPRPRTQFIGRKDEIALAQRLLASNRLVTLTGAGGAGKTRLALEVAASTAGAYADDAWFVSCAAISDTDRVLPFIAQSLGLQLTGNQAPLATLVSHLIERHSLLVLDNLEHVIDVAPEIALLLNECPQLTVLATSRIPMHLDGEQLLPVPPLDLIDGAVPSRTEIEQAGAVALFVQRCQMLKPDFELTDETALVVLEICRRLDGLPLAIELAAARVRLLTPQALLERLERRLPLLVGGPRDVPARQQTLRATIAWSYDLLPPAEQLLLRRLSILKGGWTLAAAGALVAKADAAPVDVLGSLETLIEHNLILGHESADGSTRFAMLETIREFGREQLDTHNEADDAHRCHLDYLLQEFSDAGLNWQRIVPAGLRRGDAEAENLRVALDWSSTHEPERSLRLSRAVSGFWFTRGVFREARQRLARTLAHAPEVAASLRAAALAEMGMHATTYGDFEAARADIETALDVYQGLDDGAGVATCVFLLARLASWEGSLESAEALYEQAISELRRHQVAVLPIALGNFGSVLRQRGKLDRAAAVLEEAHALAEQRDEPWGCMAILHTLGELAIERGDNAGARQAFRRGLLLQQELQDPRYIAQILEGAGWLAGAEGNAEQAALLLGAASGLRDSIGVRTLSASDRHGDSYVQRAQALISAVDWERAWVSGHALSQAEALDVALDGLTDVSSGTPAPAQRQAGLSARELDVLRLIVEGKSDREIAADLFISHHTVMRHVSNILGKLGVESRTAAATYAMRRNIR